MTAPEVFDNLPHIGAFLVFLIVLAGMFFAGLTMHRIPAVFLGIVVFIIGVVTTPVSHSVIQITPIATLGLVISVFLGILCSRLKNKPLHFLIYVPIWLFSSMLFFLALDLAANWRSNRYFYVAIDIPGLVLCGVAGVGFCLAVNLACGNLKKKFAFCLSFLLIGLLMLGVIATERNDFCRVILSGYSQQEAMKTMRQIKDLQEKFREQCILDCNGDGIGEYGYLSELAGNALPKGKEFSKNLQNYGLRKTNISGIYEKNLYLYTVYLIANNDYAKSPEKDKNTSAREAWFACFAWPALPTAGAPKTFIITPRGKIFYSDTKYHGTVSIPDPEKLFVRKPDGEVVFLPSGFDPIADWQDK